MSKIEEKSREYVWPYLNKLYEKYGELWGDMTDKEKSNFLWEQSVISRVCKKVRS